MALSNRSRHPRNYRRRSTTWELGPFGVRAFSAGTPLLVPTNAQALIDGLTIVRVRGEMLLQLATIDASLSGFSRIGVGMCVVTENAFNGGSTTVPAPIADIGWNGWLWHWTGTITGTSSATTDVATSPAGIVRVPIDSKAMRIFKNTDVLIGVIEAEDEVGVATANMMFNTRVLVKLAA